MSSETIQIPSAVMAEKSVLSIMLQEPETWIPRVLGDGLTQDHFIETGPKFELFVERFRAGKSFDLRVLATDLHASGDIEACGGTSAIYELCTYGASSGAYSHYLRLLREMRARRIAYLEGLRLSAETNVGTDPEELRESLQALLDNVTNALSSPGGMIPAKDAGQSFFDRFSDAYENGEIPGQSTGFEVIDSVSGGMKKGELWIVGAPTSCGKSVLMLQVASHVAASGKHVLVFSLEMMAPEIVGRLASCHGRIDNERITKPRTAKKHDLEKIQRTVLEIAGWKLWIDDRASQTLHRIESECIRQRDLHGPVDLVVVDYLQLVKGERGRMEQQHEEISRVSKGLKNLAKTLECPVITATQLNDEGKIKGSREPSFDADAVLIIGGDGIKVVKLRNAERGQLLPLQLNGAFQRFERR